VRLVLGARGYDIATRSLVMGILNRTTDSFYDKGAYFDMDAFLSRAEGLVAAGVRGVVGHRRDLGRQFLAGRGQPQGAVKLSMKVQTYLKAGT